MHEKMTECLVFRIQPLKKHTTLPLPNFSANPSEKSTFYASQQLSWQNHPRCGCVVINIWIRFRIISHAHFSGHDYLRKHKRKRKVLSDRWSLPTHVRLTCIQQSFLPLVFSRWEKSFLLEIKKIMFEQLWILINQAVYLFIFYKPN